MIVVKIEVWPYGSEEQSQEVDRMHIFNDGTGDPYLGNYRASWEDPRRITPGREIAQIAKVERHPRLPRGRTTSWSILREVLDQIPVGRAR